MVVGGTAGIGLRLAETYAARGRDVVITGRELERCSTAATSIAGPATRPGVRLRPRRSRRPSPRALEAVGPVDRLVLGAVDRDENTVASYDVARALRLVTLKLVGYTEVIHALLPRLTENASIVLFGGLAMRGRTRARRP